ncbi:transposase [Marinobacter sp. BGYM27]|uniref:transposase n=1 Tax=Marinobacter sp. BGYM27 TaxID=2975597 RepID=UPI0021A3456C|nr:transposase [Marinobacter sp. BGYM27]MDG5499646.1 transposase [Marinobacter sp. BGYM27]
MPRKTRMYLPGVPVHVVQRGHNRDACFFAEEDFRYYRQVLGEGLKRYGAELHAYCLMTNHVHLLLTPQHTDSISRLMQHVGRQYVQYVNRTYRRSGTLWEGRHKGSLIDAEGYLLSCYRYIELNPVTACMVSKPEEYPWSSFRFNALGEPDSLISPHSLFEALAVNGVDRSIAYRDLFRFSLPEQARNDIAKCLSASQILGSGRFREQVESALGRKAGKVGKGRPVGSLG